MFHCKLVPYNLLAHIRYWSILNIYWPVAVQSFFPWSIGKHFILIFPASDGVDMVAGPGSFSTRGPSFCSMFCFIVSSPSLSTSLKQLSSFTFRGLLDWSHGLHPRLTDHQNRNSKRLLWGLYANPAFAGSSFKRTVGLAVRQTHWT